MNPSCKGQLDKLLSRSKVYHQAGVESNISCNIYPILKVKKRHKTISNLQPNATNPVYKWHAIEVDNSNPQMVAKS